MASEGDYSQAKTSKEMFNIQSRVWDKQAFTRYVAKEFVGALRARALVPLHAKMHCMDFGCGTGNASMALYTDVQRIVAVDSSEGMIEALQAKLQEPGQERAAQVIEPLLVEIKTPEDLGERPKFDLIFTCLTFHHIEDVAGVVQVLSQLLAPGGVLACFDFEKTSKSGDFHPEDKHRFVEHHGLVAADLAKWYAAAGLSNVTVDTDTIIKKPDTKDASKILEFPFILAQGQRPSE